MLRDIDKINMLLIIILISYYGDGQYNILANGNQLAHVVNFKIFVVDTSGSVKL